MKKLLLAAALALAPAVAQAQEERPAESPPQAATAPTPTASPPAPALQAAPTPLPDADPALWAVRDEDSIVYLFGTFHLLDGRPWFNDEVKTAFDASDELVVEAIIPEDPSAIQPLVLRYAVDAQGRKLSDRLTPEHNAALSEAVSSLGVPAGAFDPLEPWFVSMTLAAVASQRLGISAEHGPEGVLIRAARSRDMPVSELEGLEWQIRRLD
ncbi:MAG: TraB/GumN family protein, partial [Allosphingosinicella sp.]